MPNIFSVPVLLIAFNRPEHTRRVLSEILKAHPARLYVFQDGTREGNTDDVIKCQQVRSIIGEMTRGQEVDLNLYYSDKNLGCGPGPAAAITWLFEHEEQGIILEDDAVPHPDFFPFAQQLLDRYNDNAEIMAIGSMKLGTEKYGDGSYFFSKMNHTLCAWATWKRAWALFDLELKDLSEKQLNHILKRYGAKLREREYWCERLSEIHQDLYGNSSWDQQFWMSIWKNGGKGILPNVNLCSNIGFDKSGTHTQDSLSPASNVPTESIFPIVCPSTEAIDRTADEYFQKTYFQPWAYGRIGFKNLPFRINKRIKRIVGHKGPWIKQEDRNI